MEQRVSLITLGVADLQRARVFYERMGWRGQQIQETVFFQAAGMVLVLWGRSDLDRDIGTSDLQRAGYGGVALAQNVRSAAEVDEIVASAASAGAVVTRSPAGTFYGGYAGYFTDPDGHVWEIAYNPGFTLAPDGTVTVPNFGAS